MSCQIRAYMADGFIRRRNLQLLEVGELNLVCFNFLHIDEELSTFYELQI